MVVLSVSSGEKRGSVPPPLPFTCKHGVLLPRSADHANGAKALARMSAAFATLYKSASSFTLAFATTLIPYTFSVAVATYSPPTVPVARPNSEKRSH